MSTRKFVRFNGLIIGEAASWQGVAKLLREDAEEGSRRCRIAYQLERGILEARVGSGICWDACEGPAEFSILLDP